jgi:citrate lyase subunit alpha/citrate CoA-transferase
VDVYVSDQGIAVHPRNVELKKRLIKAGLTIVDIEDLHKRAIAICGQPQKIKHTDKVVAQIRYRDGSVIDEIKQLVK